MTGVAHSTGLEVTGKQLEYLKEIAPAAARVAWIMNPESMRTMSGFQYMGSPLLPMATALGLELTENAMTYTVPRTSIRSLPR